MNTKENIKQPIKPVADVDSYLDEDLDTNLDDLDLSFLDEEIDDETIVEE